MSTLTDLYSWIKCLMAERDIAEYSIEKVYTAPKSEKRLGEVSFIKIMARLQNGENKIYNWVVKSWRNKDLVQHSEGFDRETVLYTQVFPIFQELQAEVGIPDFFDKFPEFYSVCSGNDRKAIIMQDLKVAGFKVHSRSIPHNVDHALLVFRNYGKFHAISLALKSKKPAIFRSLKKNLTDIFGELVSKRKMMPYFTEAFRFGISALENDGKDEIAEKYREFEEHLEDYLTNFTESNNPESVIVHGDCWNNNFLFKYQEDETHPSDICLIDFQLSRVASPIFDLSYYLYTCTSKDVLDDFDLLLQTYHTSLSEALELLDCDAGDVITLKMLNEQWKIYGKFGLSMAPYILARLGAPLVGEIHMQDVYLRRMVDVLSHFAEKFL